MSAVRTRQGFTSASAARVALAALVMGVCAGAVAPANAQQSGGIVLGDGQVSLPAQWRGVMRKRPTPAVPYSVYGVQPKGAATFQTSCPSKPLLSYFGGPVISNVRIVPVFWGSLVNPQITATTNGIAQFYADVTLSNAFGQLSEYNVDMSGGTGQVIGSGSSVAGITITPSKCSTASACTLADTDIQTELNAQIGKGVLPTISHDTLGYANTLYMVHFPPNVTITGPSGAGTSCVQFCAYHNTGTSPNGEALLYSVLPDEFTSGCSQGCGANATAFENQTATASHELAEAVTDANIGLVTGNLVVYPAAWYDNNCGEIGDICSTNNPDGNITVSGRTWTVQAEWSNKLQACVVGDSFTQTPFPAGKTVWTGNHAGSLSAIVQDNGVFVANSAFTGGGLGTLVGPQGTAIDSAGNVWVASSGTTGISVFDLNGTAVTTTPYTAGISNPGALAIDGGNTVWVANGNGTVTQLSNAGAVVSTTMDASISGPTGLAVDSSGNVWVANGATNTVDVIIGAAAPASPLAAAVTAGTQGGKP